MKIMLAVPRFRHTWPCSERWQIEAIVAVANRGHEPLWLPGDVLCQLDIQKAREYICEESIQQKADVVVMCDQDQYMSGSDTIKLAETCVKDDYTFLQAPYARRGSGNPVWAYTDDPAKFGVPEARTVLHHLDKGLPMRVYGTVGAGLSAVNVSHLEYVPKPWWIKDALNLEEDYYFSKRCRLAGRKIGVHMGLTSGEHWGAYCWRTDEMLHNLRAAVTRVETAPVSAEPSKRDGDQGRA